jgi:hypothetical protein
MFSMNKAHAMISGMMMRSGILEEVTTRADGMIRNSAGRHRRHLWWKIRQAVEVEQPPRSLVEEASHVFSLRMSVGVRMLCRIA